MNINKQTSLEKFAVDWAHSNSEEQKVTELINIKREELYGPKVGSDQKVK